MRVIGVSGQKHKRRQPEEVSLNISIPPVVCYSVIKGKPGKLLGVNIPCDTLWPGHSALPPSTLYPCDYYLTSTAFSFLRFLVLHAYANSE